MAILASRVHLMISGFNGPVSEINPEMIQTDSQKVHLPVRIALTIGWLEA